MIPSTLGFLDEVVRERAMAEGVVGLLTTWRRGGKGARAGLWGGPMAALLGLPFWLAPSSGTIRPSAYFPRTVDLQKYGVQTMLFHQISDSGE